MAESCAQPVLSDSALAAPNLRVGTSLGETVVGILSSLLSCTSNAPPDVAPAPAAPELAEPAPTEPSVEEGAYLARIAACMECHTARLDERTLDEANAMGGGIPFEGPWGVVHSANVAAVAADYEPNLLEATIRGQLAWKFQMPTDLYAGMARDDMANLLAWLQQIDPIDGPAPVNTLERSYRPPPLVAPEEVPERAPQGATVERGAYLVRIAICVDCHSPRAEDGLAYDETRFMSGGGIAFRVGDVELLPPNLTPDPETGLGSWTDDEIVAAIRTGKARDGHELHPAMPYSVAYDQMRDDDVRAIVAYLRSLPAIERAIPRHPELDHTLPLSCCTPPSL